MAIASGLKSAVLLMMITHESQLLTLCTHSWAVLKAIVGQWEAEGQMIMNIALWGQEMWKDIWACLQELEAILSLTPSLLIGELKSCGNQEADALAQV